MHKILFYNKFIIRHYMFRVLRAQYQEVKIVLYTVWYNHIEIVLYSVWYNHIETSEWSKITKIQFYKYEHTVVKFIHKFYYCVFIFIELNFRNFRPLTCFSVMIPDVV